jgi:hypothetical protein
MDERQSMKDDPKDAPDRRIGAAGIGFGCTGNGIQIVPF